jgi:RNAse (barnase) inhibitor barstar
VLELVLDASQWKTVEDLFLSFFKIVGAPEWHGKNFNALRDSIAGRDINQVATSYRIVFKNYDQVIPAVKSESDHFIAVIHELATNEGVPIEIRVETSN